MTDLGQSDRSAQVLALRRRSPSERVAYCQGYLAGLTAAKTTTPENVQILRESMEANLRAAQEERDA